MLKQEAKIDGDTNTEYLSIQHPSLLPFLAKTETVSSSSHNLTHTSESTSEKSVSGFNLGFSGGLELSGGLEDASTHWNAMFRLEGKTCPICGFSLVLQGIELEGET